MWTVQELDEGQWKELGNFENVEDAKKKQTSDNQFIFWNGPFPRDKAAETDKILEVMALNGGRILRATIGVKFELTKNPQATLCSGDCFCVVADGARGCETRYCQGDYCWWVSCGMGC